MLILVLGQVPALAQEGGDADPAKADAFKFKLYRWQEDYGYLAGKPALSDYEKLKYIPLGAAGYYLSLGGESRLRLDTYTPYLFGIGAGGVSFTSFQARTLLHADAHFGPYFRVFTQIDAATEQGRLTQRAFDRSDPDLRQAFADFNLPVGAGTATLRLGRQEIFLGPTRWLAVRDPTNLRRAFDGALAKYDDKSLSLRVFALRPAINKGGAFDDGTSTVEAFWGGYATARQPFGAPFKIDGYVFGKQLDAVTYSRGSARETRYTVGSRLYGTLLNIDYKFEGAYQFGTFGATNISAFGGFGELVRDVGTWQGVTPRLGLRANYASGSGNLKSGALRTFAAPYPAASAVTEMSLLSLSNVANLQPFLDIYFPNDLRLGANWNFVRKVAAADGGYGPAGTIFKANSKAKGVASIGQLDLTWDLTAFLQVQVLYDHVFAGSFLTAAKGRGLDYSRAQIQARF